MKFSYFQLVSQIIALTHLSSNGLRRTYQPSMRSWNYLDSFTFVPLESSYKYSHLAGRVDLEIFHSNVVDDISMWILGFSFPSILEWNLNIESKGASILSCADRVNIANYATFVTNLNTSMKTYRTFNATTSPIILNSMNTDPQLHATILSAATSYVDTVRHSYKYKQVTSIEITRQNLKSNKPQSVYWVATHCDISCSAEVGKYCQAPVDAIINAHYYHVTEGGSASSSGNPLVEEVSFEYHGIQSLTISFWVIQLVLCMAMRFVRISLVKIQRDHHLVKLLEATVHFYQLRYLFSMIYWIEYSKNGIPWQELDITSNILLVLSMAGIFLLVTCLAGGWTIVRRKFKVIGRMRLAFFMVSFITLSIGAVSWNAILRPQSSAFYFDSPPGYFMLVILALTGFRFSAICRRTVTTYGSHIMFFKVLHLFGLYFIWHLPLCTLFSLIVDPVERYKVYLYMTYIISAIVQAVLIFMFYPHCCPGLFPFHATTQDMQVYRFRTAPGGRGTVGARKKGTPLGEVGVEPEYGGEDIESPTDELDIRYNGSLCDDEPAAAASATGRPTTGAVSSPGGGSVIGRGSSGGVISFTGGFSNLFNAEGRLVPPSKFDRDQLARLKTMAMVMDARVKDLAECSARLWAALDRVAVDTPAFIVDSSSNMRWEDVDKQARHQSWVPSEDNPPHREIAHSSSSHTITVERLEAPHAISRNGVEACIIPEAADGRVYRGSQGKVTGGHEERRGDHTRRDDVKNMSKGHSGVLEKDRECVQNQRQDLHDEKQDDIEEALGKRRGVGLWGRYRRGSSSSGGGKGAVGLPRRGPEKKQNISQGGENEGHRDTDLAQRSSFLAKFDGVTKWRPYAAVPHQDLQGLSSTRTTDGQIGKTPSSDTVEEHEQPLSCVDGDSELAEVHIKGSKINKENSREMSRRQQLQDDDEFDFDTPNMAGARTNGTGSSAAGGSGGTGSSAASAGSGTGSGTGIDTGSDTGSGSGSGTAGGGSVLKTTVTYSKGHVQQSHAANEHAENHSADFVKPRSQPMTGQHPQSDPGLNDGIRDDDDDQKARNRWGVRAGVVDGLSEKMGAEIQPAHNARNVTGSVSSVGRRGPRGRLQPADPPPGL